MSRGASRRRSYGPRQRELKRRTNPLVDDRPDAETEARLDHGIEGGRSALAPVAREQPGGDAT